MRALPYILGLWIACSAAPAPAPDPGAGPGSDDPTEPDDDPLLTDEAIARAMIDGRLPVDEGIRRIAERGGFPVATAAGGFLFVGAPWLCADQPCALVGDHGGWVPEPLHERAAIPWIEVEVPDPEGSGYKLLVAPGADQRYVQDPLARSYTYDSFGPMSFVRPPRDAARLDRWFMPGTQEIEGRELVVHAPAGAGPWPTLYMQDGQNLFDSRAPFGHWGLQDTLPTLSGPLLIVGIPAGRDRLAEYAHVDDTIRGTAVRARGPAYAAFVAEIVRPRIEAAYGEASVTGLLGSSMGGLASLAIAHAQPDAWDFAGSMSGTLGWGRLGAEGPTLREIYVADPRPDLVIFVDSGGNPGAQGCRDLNGDGSYADDPDHTDNYCTNRAFADALAASGQRWNETLFHWHEPGALHNEAAWAARVFRPLEIFLDLAR